MAIRSLSGKKFLLVSAAAVLGLGVAASFMVPTVNASQNAPTSVVTVAPALNPQASSTEGTSTEGTSTEGTSTEATGIDCNNGLDASGAPCDGGPVANPNDNSVEAQGGSENQSEITVGVDGDNVQTQN